MYVVDRYIVIPAVDDIVLNTNKTKYGVLI